MRQPAGGVQPGHQHPGDILRVYAALRQPGLVYQRSQPGAGAAVYHLQPLLDQVAVLPHQGGDIGYGSQRHQVHHLLRLLFFAHSLQQRLDELEGYPHPGQLREGVLGVGQLGVHGGYCWGYLGEGGVVVGDDDVQPLPLRLLHLGDGGNAAVHGDHQADAVLSQALQGGRLQPVALGEAVGYVGDDIAAQARQPLDQKGGAGDAVGVEVPVDGYLLPGEQRSVDSARGRLYVGEEAGVGGEVAAAGQERLYLVMLGDAAVIEELRRQRGQSCGAGEELGRGGGQEVPSAMVQALSPLRFIILFRRLYLQCSLGS